MNSKSVEQHLTAKRNAAFQHSVISREQLRLIGWTDSMITSQLRSHRRERLLPGIYSVNTGEGMHQTWCWAAYLYCGETSALGGESALAAWGLGKSALPIQLQIAHWVQRSEVAGKLAVGRKRLISPVRNPRRLPPTVVAHFAVIEATRTLNATAVMELISTACQSGKTSPAQLERALALVRGVKHRKLISALIAEQRDGLTTPIEVDGVRLILRAHGLPEGTHQKRGFVDAKLIIRDLEIDPYGLIIEWDGRLGHADPHSRFRDHHRDNRRGPRGQKIPAVWLSGCPRKCMRSGSRSRRSADQSGLERPSNQVLGWVSNSVLAIPNRIGVLCSQVPEGLVG